MKLLEKNQKSREKISKIFFEKKLSLEQIENYERNFLKKNNENLYKRVKNYEKN